MQLDSQRLTNALIDGRLTAIFMIIPEKADPAWQGAPPTGNWKTGRRLYLLAMLGEELAGYCERRGRSAGPSK
jgi:hypothetical protein